MRNSSYNFIPILLKLCRHCDHALKICMWLGYTPQINFFFFFFFFFFWFSLNIFYCLFYVQWGWATSSINIRFSPPPTT